MASGHQQRLRARQRPSILLPLLGRCQVPAALLRSFRVDWGDSQVHPAHVQENPRVPARSQGSDLASSPPCAPAPRHAPLVSRLTALQPLFLAVPYAPGDSSKFPYPTLSPGTLFPNIHSPNPAAAKPGHPVPQSSSRFLLPFFQQPLKCHTLYVLPHLSAGTRVLPWWTLSCPRVHPKHKGTPPYRSTDVCYTTAGGKNSINTS